MKNKKYSTYRGVSFHLANNKFCAQIKVKGKIKYLGYFDNEVEAALAYNSAAVEFHKEKAKLNFISSLTSSTTTFGLKVNSFKKENLAIQA